MAPQLLKGRGVDVHDVIRTDSVYLWELEFGALDGYWCFLHRSTVLYHY